MQDAKRGKEKGAAVSRCPLALPTLKLLIHLILLGFASVSLAPDARWYGLVGGEAERSTTYMIQ